LVESGLNVCPDSQGRTFHKWQRGWAVGTLACNHSWGAAEEVKACVCMGGVLICILLPSLSLPIYPMGVRPYLSGGKGDNVCVWNK
jgi:hypothetical protein